MTKLHVYINGGWRALPLGACDAFTASQASRMVRNAFVTHKPEGKETRAYFKGRRILPEMEAAKAA